MKRFTRLYQELNETTKVTHKLSSLVRYFHDVNHSDAAWAMWFLCGNRPRRIIPFGQLRNWCIEAAGIPEWLFAEAYGAVGDLAETIALLLPPPETDVSHTLTEWINSRLLPLTAESEENRKKRILLTWSELYQTQRFIFNKLLAGGFKVGVSQRLVVRALAVQSGVPADVIAHRLRAPWTPSAEFFASLLSTNTNDADISRPYPFCLASEFTVPLCEEVSLLSRDMTAALSHELGPISDWILEWKWDGIRAQVVRRSNSTFIWSQGEELLTERFPEVLQSAMKLPNGTVLDGELVAWKSGKVQPLIDLQKRITRKTIGKKLLAEVPVRFIAFDVLEYEGNDVRKASLSQRRVYLDSLLPGDRSRPRNTELVSSHLASEAGTAVESTIQASRIMTATSWNEVISLRQSSREKQMEGLILKRSTSEYGIGPDTGLWWRWKLDPYLCNAVLIYAHRAQDKRTGEFSEYTFAAWDNDQLIPIARAHSGLTSEEVREVHKFIRENTLERFGPVLSVKPELVFELAFEGLQLSHRHKSGIAVRIPRIVRWRKDKNVQDADTLERIRSLIHDCTEDQSFGDDTQRSPSSASRPARPVRSDGFRLIARRRHD